MDTETTLLNITREEYLMALGIVAAYEKENPMPEHSHTSKKEYRNENDTLPDKDE